MTPGRTAREIVPEPVVRVLDEFRREFSLDVHLWQGTTARDRRHLYPPASAGTAPLPDSILLAVPRRRLGELTLEVRAGGEEGTGDAGPPANALRSALEYLYEYADEVRAFAHEMADRYEEINLLYSISEILGSLLHLRDASHTILSEVCDVLGARRGSLWVLDRGDGALNLVASVGDDGLEGPLDVNDPTAVTAQVFREGRPVILSAARFELVVPELETMVGADRDPAGMQGTRESHETRGKPGTASTTLAPARAGAGVDDEDSVLSVPIRYTPPDGSARTVGVINLIGRHTGGRFTASDQKLLAAIASQVGAALENNRLFREGLERERVTREMELAHDLQMKLLPTAESFDPTRVAARVESAESVGGDFYHFFRVSGDRYGVMIGDVSGHGFPAALIMALSMSAGTIYASEVRSPARVLQGMGEALMDELESTEMYLTLFYGVIDPASGELTYANAGHPHAFVIRGDGDTERLPAMDPPMGIAGTVEYQQRTVPWSTGGDLLLLFTDGLSDNLAAESRVAAEKYIVSETVRLRGEPVSHMVDALFDLKGNGVSGERNVRGDDRTAVVLRV